MDDLISRQAAIDALESIGSLDTEADKKYARSVFEALPSVQPKHTEERTETHSCDCVSRQAALDIERNATVDTNPSHFEAHQKFMQFMDDAEISSFGRWQWSNGFNTALTEVRIDLENLPSAQPENIRCKECKHWLDIDDGRQKHRMCADIYGDWFCADAERRTDDR